MSRLQAVPWLVVKDLQILRRSPLVVSLLVIYPIVLAVLIGVALSRGPERPTVAFLNQVPRGSSTFELAGKRIDTRRYQRELFEAVDPIFVGSRKEAIEKVKSGNALGALVVPFDLPQKLASQLQRPTLEVYVNQEDPVKARLVDNTIGSQVARANLALSHSFAKIAASYANLLLRGGRVDFLGQNVDVLGLRPSERLMQRAAKTLPPGSKERRELQKVIEFAHFSAANFNLSDEALSAIREPIRVDKHVVSGRTPSLTTFATALAIAVSMMFVTVILSAAALALEREEGAYARLLRSGVSPAGLLLAKVALAVICSFALVTILLGVLELFVSFEWSRVAAWPSALLAAAIAFAALGVAIGGLAREVRTATLAAIMISLPLAFLALVPSGTVSGPLYEVVRIVSAVFPFKATVNGLDRAFYGAGPSLYVSVAHLLVLAGVFSAAARLSLRRFGAS